MSNDTSISYSAALNGLEISAITLTIFNGVAAGLVVTVALFDNYQQRKTLLSISWERRTPLYLGITILLAQIVFAARELLEIGSLVPTTADHAQAVISGECLAANQASWWGMLHRIGNELNLAIWVP